MSEQKRKESEAEFHDLREKDRQTMTERDFYKKYPNKSFYKLTKRSIRDFEKITNELNNKIYILDYCCGNGELSHGLAERGFEHITGIDISSQEIRTAKNSTTNTKNPTFLVMDAENLEFDDNYFDLIICSGVLHHLDLKIAYKEIYRVLKPGGKVICLEAYDHNPLIRLYRKRTPHLRTPWEIDHILQKKDLDLGKQIFGSIEIRYYYLITLLLIPFRNFPKIEKINRFIDIIDSIFCKLPYIRQMSWQVMFILYK